MDIRSFRFAESLFWFEYYVTLGGKTITQAGRTDGHTVVSVEALGDLYTRARIVVLHEIIDLPDFYT